MENKINIAKILKNCPKGMELDCTMYDGVEFMEVDTESDTIILRVENKFKKRLNKYGKNDNIDCAKCVIFPKGKNTWEGFVPPCKFKDGDVVVDDSGAIFLYKRVHPYYEEPYADFYCGLSSEFRSFIIKTGEAQHCGKISSIRYATKKEKKKLFDAIKANGYHWNTETKTLEKLLKFKVGNKVRSKGSDRHYIIENIEFDRYILSNNQFLKFTDEHDFELVPNKFDISTLKPFESSVLVRTENSDIWEGDIFVRYDRNATVNKFHCIGGWYEKCIPFKGNERLLGTIDDCSNYYKTWEE